MFVPAPPQRFPRSPSPEQIADLRLASSKMTGATRRAFQAERTLKYCAGNARRAATVFGWGRHTIELGLAERRTGMICVGAQSAYSGRKRWEDPQPQAAQALRQLAEAHAQQDPTFRTSLAYTRLTAAAALHTRSGQGYAADHLPAPSTMATVLHRLGFRLRKVVKAKPQKKMKETDAMFDNIKKKTPKPRQGRTSNACVSIVKQPCTSAILRAVVSLGVIPTPVITTWGARRSMFRVGSWMQILGH